ncbi:hypothetical protein [Lactobacillus sp. PV034]|uniref:aggregation-promoting factor n=1 Tax=Lactobacillus sp. PV034 TaxID=2594495 RepID=UPI0022405ACB|nr:hypothetical protein [Lactobacillus sp. PV034]QNQ81526.1 hypothetical protein FP432_04735 [Lactobacillus sp. PV034]
MAAGVAFASLVALTTTTNKDVHAATTANDPEVVTVNYVPDYGIAVWNHANTLSHTTGQYLPHATSWKVIDSAYDAQGNKWYDLGKNQWVMAKWVRAGLNSVDPDVAYDYVAPQTQAPVAQTTNNTYSSQATTSSSSNNSSYTSSVSGSEAAAKAWIAGRESGGSYTARNGQYVGKYQLSAAYLNGDYSAANQERVADNYVKSRYGSWTAAQSFWQANGWY